MKRGKGLQSLTPIIGWMMLKSKIIHGGIVLVMAMTMLAAPARHGYSMNQIRSLANWIWPGVWPESETKKQAKPKPPPPQRSRTEALTLEERKILLRLLDRKRRLDERDTLLNQREEELRAMRDNIQHQVDELNRLQTRIEASIEAKKTQDAENLKKVISLYNGMDPKIAAQKLETFDSKMAADILLGMNQRKAARLLEALPPDKAKRITETIVRKEPATK